MFDQQRSLIALQPYPVALQALVTRRTSPVEPVIIGVGKLSAGTVYNALAESAVLEGTTRTVSLAAREQVREQVSRTFRSIAGMYSGSGEAVCADFAALLLTIRRCAWKPEQLPGGIHVVTGRTLSLSGDNFAEHLLHVPGAYAWAPAT